MWHRTGAFYNKKRMAMNKPWMRPLEGLFSLPQAWHVPHLEKLENQEAWMKWKKGLTFEDSWINNTPELKVLLQLRSRVICSRLEMFHWNVGSCVEFHEETQGSDNAEIFENPISSQDNVSSATQARNMIMPPAALLLLLMSAVKA